MDQGLTLTEYSSVTDNEKQMRVIRIRIVNIMRTIIIIHHQSIRSPIYSVPLALRARLGSASVILSDQQCYTSHRASVASGQITQCECCLPPLGVLQTPGLCDMGSENYVKNLRETQSQVTILVLSVGDSSSIASDAKEVSFLPSSLSSDVSYHLIR